MGLEDLQKKLYQEKEPAEDKKESPPALPPVYTERTLPSALPASWGGESSDFLAQRKKRRFLWTTVISVIALLLVLAGWILWRGLHSFDTSNVALEIFGQERIVGGEEVNFVVRYKNNTKTALEEAVLTFVYSTDSLPEDENLKKMGDSILSERKIGTLPPGQEGQGEFKTKILGDKDSSQKFSAKLTYRPANFNSEFSSEKEFEGKIVAVPIVLNFDLPEKVVSGQDLSLSLQYINTSDTEFSGLKIKIDWPENFVLSKAYPVSSGGQNIWDLEKLASRAEGKIVFNGVLSGLAGDDKFFRAQVGVEKDGRFVAYSQAAQSTMISISPLWLEQSLAGADSASADPNQFLNYILKYRNTTEFPLGPVEIRVKIESQAVDLSSVMAPGGFFNNNDNTIVWNVSTLPALEKLAGKSENELSFSFRIKDHLPVINPSDKNFTVLTAASIDSPNVPFELLGTKLAGKNELTVKVNSRVVFYQKGFYQDSLIPNSGPLPPRVGEKTTYTVRWQILNISNNISDAEVSAVLPNWMQWPEKISLADGSLKYDVSSRKVTWKIGKVSAGTGVVLPVKQIAFQVALVPSSSQVGSSPELIKGAKLEARDDFTETPVSLTAPDLKTSLTDDPAVGYDKGTVVN